VCEAFLLRDGRKARERSLVANRRVLYSKLGQSRRSRSFVKHSDE
jgi:hypothetical protein